MDGQHRHSKVKLPDVNLLVDAIDAATDAHRAALAIEHGCTLCSNDRDFERFDGLLWENPIDG